MNIPTMNLPSTAAPVLARPARRIPWMLLALGLVGIVLIAAAAYWALVLRFVQTTDDAYVGGDVTVLAPKVNGFVTDVLVQDNQRVKAGQTLVRLDSRDYDARLAQTEAEVSSARAAFIGSALNLSNESIMKKLLVEILALASLAACAVQPATHADLPDTVKTTAPANWLVDVPKQDADPADWWTQFNDPVMHELVASVLNSNLDVQAAVERVKQAQALTTQKRAALLPQLDANALASDTRQNTPPPLGYVRQAGIGLTLSWTPDVFGGERLELLAAQAQLIGREHAAGRSDTSRIGGGYGIGVCRSAMGASGVEDSARQRGNP